MYIYFFRNACTKSGSLPFSQFSGCWLFCLFIYLNSSLKLSIELSYTQIVRIVHLFSQIINRTIIYTIRQKHSTFLRNYQHNYHIHKSSRTLKSSKKLSIELSYTLIVRIVHLFSEIINRSKIYKNRQEYSTLLIYA